MTKFLQGYVGGPIAFLNKSKLAAASKNVNQSGLDIDLCTKDGGQMRHSHAEMTTRAKLL